MKIYRLETFEIFPDKDQTIEDIRASIKKTQDLTVICCIDFGADYSTTTGTLFQIDFTNGLFSKSST